MTNLPHLIFTLSPGRCGTKYLAALLSTVPGVHVEHEGKPDFVDWARAARRDPAEARLFWEREKLPYIAGLGCDVYAETSHLFGKGFVQPLLDLGIVPDVLVIQRNHRDVALSYWRRGSIPVRTMMGNRYLLHPEVAEFHPPARWWSFSDYQLCYWYVLEMASRTIANIDRLHEAGATVHLLRYDELAQRESVLGCLNGMGLEPGSAALDAIFGQRYNATPAGVVNLMPPGDIDEQEQGVVEAIKNADNVEPDTRIKVDIVVLSMGMLRKELAATLMAVGYDRRYNIISGFAATDPTSNNRCQICKEFVDSERRPDWLMMIDEDQSPNGDFLQWVESDADVISFATPCWKPATSPHSPIVWNVQLNEDNREFAPTVSNPDVTVLTNMLPDEPVTEVASAGTGAILIHRRVLEHPALRAPFIDEFNEFGIRIEGHDLAFCRRAREVGFKVASVLQNPSSHYKTIDLLDVVRVLRT